MTYLSGTPQATIAAVAVEMATGFDWSDQDRTAGGIRSATRLMLARNDPVIVVTRSLGLTLMFAGQDTQRNDNVQIDRMGEIDARVGTTASPPRLKPLTLTA